MRRHPSRGQRAALLGAILLGVAAIVALVAFPTAGSCTASEPPGCSYGPGPMNYASSALLAVGALVLALRALRSR